MSDVFVLKKTLELIENGTELALVTITDSKGSTPRKKGAQMVVLTDGSIIGTIGGGAIENRLIQLALEAIDKGESQNLHLPLSTEGIEMVCGGEVDVFIQVFKTKPKLIIVGGGHVSLALYKIASLLSFDIIIFEDRKEFLDNERFPLAKELIFGDIKDNLRQYPIDNNTYIVIATRGHKYDEIALETVIDSDAKYIGVMGSDKKVITLFKNLKEKGINEESISKIYAPIGIDVSDNSPEEIAVSIVSEILAVKNNKIVKHKKH